MFVTLVLGMATLATIYVFYARSHYGWSDGLVGIGTDGATLTPTFGGGSLEPRSAADVNSPTLNLRQAEDLLDWCEANGKPMPRFQVTEAGDFTIRPDVQVEERTAV